MGSGLTSPSSPRVHGLLKIETDSTNPRQHLHS